MCHAVVMDGAEIEREEKKIKRQMERMAKKNVGPEFSYFVAFVFCDQAILRIAHISTIRMKFPQPTMTAMKPLATEGVGFVVHSMP